MTQFYTPLGTSCADAARLLEKRVLGEFLSDSERGELAEHLDGCAVCRDFVACVSRIPAITETLSDADIDAARYAMKKKRIYLAESENRNRLIGIAAAVIAAAVVPAVVWLSPLLPKDRVEPKGAKDGALECDPRPPTEPLPGVLMTYCGDKEPDIAVPGGREVTVSLHQGTVGLRIDPEHRNSLKVRVETREGEVRVKGTIFTVRVDSTAALLEVFRGAVEFVPAASKAERFVVTKGQGADLSACTLFDLSMPKTELLRQALDEAAAARDLDEQLLAMDETELGPEARAPDAAEPRNSAILSTPPEFSEATGPDHEGASISPDEAFKAKSGGAPKEAVLSIDALVQEAQSCLIDRDWPCAASRYREILKRYPGRAESTAISVSLAKIELLRLGEPQKALDHYLAYRQSAPNGPLAEEALFGIAEAYRRLGGRKEELETLRRFSERYPRSLKREKVETRLRQLEGDKAP